MLARVDTRCHVLSRLSFHQVRGPWVASAYYAPDGTPDNFKEDGWMATGDVASIDADG